MGRMLEMVMSVSSSPLSMPQEELSVSHCEPKASPSEKGLSLYLGNKQKLWSLSKPDKKEINED